MKKKKRSTKQPATSAKANAPSSAGADTSATKQETPDNGKTCGTSAKSAAAPDTFGGQISREASARFTPRVKAMLGNAAREAEAMGDTYTGTEHLLLAMLKHGESGEMTGVAYRALAAAGLTYDRVQFGFKMARWL